MARQGVVPARKNKRKSSKKRRASIGFGGIVPPRKGPHASLTLKRMAVKKKLLKKKSAKKAATRKKVARRSKKRRA